MARIRTIKPEFWTDEDMSEVSEPACLLAIGLLNYADDEGYFNANPKLIRAAVFPIREPSRTIPVLLLELSSCGYIAMFSTPDGKHFGHICNFARHQVVNKPKASKIKDLELIPYEYGTHTGGLPLGKDQGTGKGKEETPYNACEENLPPPVDNFAALAGSTPGEAAGGKFAMFDDWQPDPDLVRRAAVWGINLKTPPKDTEIAAFITYWKAEGKFFAQAQWEQKLARNVLQQRGKTASPGAPPKRDIHDYGSMDYDIPEGFRTS